MHYLALAELPDMLKIRLVEASISSVVFIYGNFWNSVYGRRELLLCLLWLHPSMYKQQAVMCDGGRDGMQFVLRKTCFQCASLVCPFA